MMSVAIKSFIVGDSKVNELSFYKTMLNFSAFFIITEIDSPQSAVRISP
jgi:hypothetical protein